MAHTRSDPQISNGTQRSGPQENGSQRLPSHYVGIGASAGGLEAIEDFVSNMPTTSGLAFIIVQHLSPDYKSLMVELLSKRTDMPVFRAEDGMRVVADAIYLIPPKKSLTIFHGKLILSSPEQSRAGIFLPIDIFLRSLADDQGDRAIAIILSGTGSDGMRGVRAVKESGGIIMVQDEESARFDGMPRSAISTGMADFILPPGEMPQQLIAYIDHPEKTRSARSDTILTDEDGLTRIFAMLRDHHKIDFTYYKPSTVVRRIERRMTVNHINELRDYVKFLESYPRELSTLYRELLIGVTSFFRDAEAFKTLSDTYLPELFEKAGGDQIRIWIAGCSTGEEAYTLAILCRESLKRLGKRLDVKIFATDVDNDAIMFAGSGVYPESIAADLPPGHLTKYFIKHDDSYRVSRSIREMVVFAQHNLIKDPPFTNIELISCRNLLIYLQPVLQLRVLDYFNFSLNKNGLLLLGHSETTGEMADHFEPLSHKWKLYRSKGLARDPLTRQEIYMDKQRPPRSGRHLKRPMPRGLRRYEEERILDRLLDALAGDYVPLAMMVNEQMELLHVLGDATGVLGFPSGHVVNDLSRVVVKDLSIPLSTGLQKVFKHKEEVRYSNIRIGHQGQKRVVDMRLKPLPQKQGQAPLAVVFVEEVERKRAADSSTDIAPYDIDKDAAQRIQDLEQELQFSRENLQATIEELETSNEELQATNEELLASNEELQSTNEELQSVNEELHTVNTEYQHKIMELTELNNDMRNYIESSEVATVFIDENLEVRKFTPQASRLFKITAKDIGRPITHLSHHIVNVHPHEIVEEVHETNRPRELEVQTDDGAWYLMRALPYRIGGGAFSGSVLSSVDISALKSVQLELEQGQRKLSQQLQLYATVTKLAAVFEAPDMTIHRAAEQVVDLVPQAYANTDRMRCRLKIGDRAYTSAGFETSACKATMQMRYGDQSASLTVYDLTADATPQACSAYEAESLVLKTLGDRLAILFGKLDSEIKLRESEAKFRLLADHVEDVFWMRSPALDHLTYVSPACERIWGLSSDQLQAHPSAFVEKIHPEDRQQVAEALAAHAEGRWDVSYRLQTNGGGVRWIHDRGFPIYDGNHELTMMCGFTRDVTDTKTKENHLMADVSKLRSTFERAAIGIALVDMQGRPVDTNPALQKLLGYSGQELRDQGFIDLTHPDDAAKDLALYGKMVAGQCDSYSQQKRYLTKQKEVIQANLTVSLVRDESGAPILAIALVQKLSPDGCAL